MSLVPRAVDQHTLQGWRRLWVAFGADAVYSTLSKVMLRLAMDLHTGSLVIPSLVNVRGFPESTNRKRLHGDQAISSVSQALCFSARLDAPCTGVVASLLAPFALIVVEPHVSH